MAYTSTSPVSSSPWYGPQSSPIISPSRWQTQVLDNLCILALHNHSGSAGEGSASLSTCSITSTGQQGYLTPFFPNASTNWILETGINTWPGYSRVSTSSNGASITYSLYLGTGIHSFKFFYGKGSSFGIITASLKGSSPLTTSTASSYDGYISGAESPPTGANALNQIGEFQFRIYTVNEQTTLGASTTGSLVGSGKYILKLGISGSNTSSTGYIFRLGYFQII